MFLYKIYNKCKNAAPAATAAAVTAATAAAVTAATAAAVTAAESR